MLCTTCDTHNDAGARFCRVCGSAFAAPAPDQAVRTAPSRPPYAISDAPVTGPACPACARPNPVGAKYCVYCASTLQTSRQAFQPSYAMPIGYAGPQPAATLAIDMTNSANLLIRAVWFFFIGWWLGLLWSLAAWLFNLTLIGLPVGLLMLNATPTVTTLQRRARGWQYQRASGPEHPLALRAIWFVLIGWWASLVWLLAAWAFSLTLVLMPISFWMWNRIPTITTLAAEQ